MFKSENVAAFRAGTLFRFEWSDDLFFMTDTGYVREDGEVTTVVDEGVYANVKVLYSPE